MEETREKVTAEETAETAGNAQQMPQAQVNTPEVTGQLPTT